MRKLLVSASLVAFCLAGSAFAQNMQSTGTPRHPLDVSQIKSVINSPIAAKHTSSNRLSASTNAAIQGAAAASNPITIKSVPFFNGSFTFQGQTFPFSMMGHAPQKGGTTQIDTSYLAISFFFDEFVDQNGNNIVIDATGNTNNLLNGPDFERFPFTTGNTQFSDAVQRAEFFNVMKKPHEDDSDDAWHTLLEQPRQFKPITVEVPFGSSLVFSDGTNFFAFVDINFMNSQLNTLVQTEDIHTNELPIFVTHNTVYADFFFGGCCIGGFHTAFETNQVGNTVFVQTFAFATSLDAAVSNDIFGDPTLFADVAAMSHEISETYNDPFVNNIVPSWQFPGAPPGVCSNVLETGDPVENLANPTFPVMVDGFLYHPQTEALLQWFSRENPSSAFQGDYSYPGNNLTSASTACPTGP
ncbi:MAG TPA: hypothetical protein VKY85_19015 [Candidatus Angelobacter sp.]|nr:hypothetical protein [Candidatus Angelobacter sp.]